MFDTVKLGISNVTIEIEELEKENKIDLKDFTYMTRKGEKRTNFTFRSNGIFFKYCKQIRNLEIELSIPKFLYNTNVKMLRVEDIELFWLKIIDTLKKYKVEGIIKEQIRVKRLDVSYNFNVGKENIESYINFIKNIKLSKKVVKEYGENETVLFKNKSSSICFYNKEKEVIARKESPDILKQAQGILRLEVRPSKYHMRQYSKTTRALDFISIKYFSYILEKYEIDQILNRIDYSISNQEKEDILKALNSISTSDVEKVFGFNLLKNILGEAYLLDKGIYKKATYKSRTNLLKYFNMVTSKSNPILPRLKITAIT